MIPNSPKVAMEHHEMMRQKSFARAAGLAETKGGPNCGPKIGNFRQLPATSETVDESAECAFDQG